MLLYMFFSKPKMKEDDKMCLPASPLLLLLLLVFALSKKSGVCKKSLCSKSQITLLPMLSLSHFLARVERETIYIRIIFGG